MVEKHALLQRHREEKDLLLREMGSYIDYFRNRLSFFHERCHALEDMHDVVPTWRKGLHARAKERYAATRTMLLQAVDAFEACTKCVFQISPQELNSDPDDSDVPSEMYQFSDDSFSSDLSDCTVREHSLSCQV